MIDEYKNKSEDEVFKMEEKIFELRGFIEFISFVQKKFRYLFIRE